jgi:hypothetical protein
MAEAIDHGADDEMEVTVFLDELATEPANDHACCIRSIRHE